MDGERQEKPPKTPEELAEIAYLDRLRSGEGEVRPVGLPLACVVTTSMASTAASFIRSAVSAS